MGGGGWLKTSEHRHIVGGGLKLLKKPSYDIWTPPYYCEQVTYNCADASIYFTVYAEAQRKAQIKTNVTSK